LSYPGNAKDVENQFVVRVWRIQMGELIIVLNGVQAVIGVLLNIFFVVLAYRFVRATERIAGSIGRISRSDRNVDLL